MGVNDGPCAFEGCTTKAHAKGLCHKHYQWQHQADGVCSRIGCTRPAFTRKTCRECYEGGKQRFSCSVEGCAGQTHCKGLCAKHYEAQRVADNDECQNGCGRPAMVSRPVCTTCRSRERYQERKPPVKKHEVHCPDCGETRMVTTSPSKAGRCRSCALVERTRIDAARGPRWRLTHEGYRRATWQGSRILEHRVVMEEWLGRPLRAEEFVHHKNGIRHDNRLENLELWTTWHPPGQRMVDKVIHAVDVLREYAPRLLDEQIREPTEGPTEPSVNSHK